MVDIPINAVAYGNYGGNPPDGYVTPTGLPLVDFVESLGRDPDQARLQLIGDEEIGNVDDDPENEHFFVDGNILLAVTLDVDGDGEPDYVLRYQNENNRVLHSGSQDGDNVASLNGSISLVPIDDIDGPPVYDFGGQNILLSNDGPFEVGVNKPVVNMGSGRFIVGDPNDPLFPPCFTSGTSILTPNGERPIETLVAGDQVSTLDHAAQTVRWIGYRWLSRAYMESHPKFRPVRIRAGSLGEGVPTADLEVSPQHRILVRSPIAQRMFGQDEVLVPAKDLVGIEGIEVAADNAGVRYIHILLDHHEILIANGAKAESLYLGSEAEKALGPAAMDEILALFPRLKERMHAARIFVRGARARKMASRHRENQMELQRI